jgi:hypothetical protein
MNHDFWNLSQVLESRLFSRLRRRLGLSGITRSARRLGRPEALERVEQAVDQADILGGLARSVVERGEGDEVVRLERQHAAQIGARPL